MKTKHTAGPWVVKKTRDIWPDSKSAGVTVMKERGSYEWKGEMYETGTYICHIPDNPRAQYQGNARLIAAAPEMLEALKVAKELLQDIPQTMRMKVIWDAIAKATGGDE